MNRHGQPIKTHSDADGTAFEKIHWGPKEIRQKGAGKYTLDLARNMAKYPLGMVEEYPAFLRGVRAGGLVVGSLVTRRPDRLPRRMATKRSISDHGLGGFFYGDKRAIHAGSEYGKGVFLAQEATADGIVAFTDDRPERVGLELVKAFRDVPSNGFERHVVIGAVNTKERESRLDQLFTAAETMGMVDTLDGSDGGICIAGQGFSVEVVKLAPYSEVAGKSFANAVIEYAGLMLEAV